MAKRWWRPETGIFLGLWLLLMIGGRSRFFQDPGTFWHTVVGEQMLQTHALIYEDAFSFTFAGHRWSPHQWLGECLMALLHRLDGLDTLLLATVTILAGLYTWLAQRLIRAGLHWSLAAVVVGLTVAASSSHFHIRAHIGTIVFLGVTFAFLCDYEAGRASLRRMFWLVPVYLLWTSIHGGMLGGLATMGFALAGWCGYRVLGRASPVTGFAGALAFAALIGACALTMFVNPYGVRMPQIWLEIMDGDLPTIIQEHAPLNPAKPDGWMVLLFALVYLAVLVDTWPRWPRWPRVTWLLPLVWFYLACTRIRHAPLFSIAAALAIADILPHTRWAARQLRKGGDLFQPRSLTLSAHPAWGPALLPIGVVLLTAMLQAAHVPAPVVGHGWARLDPAYWPVEVLPELQALQGRGSERLPIFNEYLFGGFLIYQTPGFRVFVDDRCELYGDRWLHEYVQAEWQDTEKKVREWEDAYPPFSLALTRTGSGFDAFFGQSRGWEPVRRTEAATLYRRVEVETPWAGRPSANGTGSSAR